MSIRDHFVYRVYDAAGQLLYVGCTKRLDKRWAEHKAERPGMVAAARRFRLQGPFARVTARELERVAIRSEEPLIGWTPAKHREKCARNRWIKDRVRELCDSDDPQDIYAAITQACKDADDVFPDPDEHERAYRRGESPLHSTGTAA